LGRRAAIQQEIVAVSVGVNLVVLAGIYAPVLVDQGTVVLIGGVPVGMANVMTASAVSIRTVVRVAGFC
jgi:hypothetical protein